MYRIREVADGAWFGSVRLGSVHSVCRDSATSAWAGYSTDVSSEQLGREALFFFVSLVLFFFLLLKLERFLNRDRRLNLMLVFAQNFEGIDYGDRKLRDQMRAGFIDIGRRERKPAAVKAYAPAPLRVGELDGKIRTCRRIVYMATFRAGRCIPNREAP